jgi:hypothetical protein
VAIFGRRFIEDFFRRRIVTNYRVSLVSGNLTFLWLPGVCCQLVHSRTRASIIQSQAVADSDDLRDPQKMAKKRKQTSRGRKQDHARVAGGQNELRDEAKKTRKLKRTVKRAVKMVDVSRKRVERALQDQLILGKIIKFAPDDWLALAASASLECVWRLA